MKMELKPIFEAIYWLTTVIFPRLVDAIKRWLHGMEVLVAFRSIYFGVGLSC